MATSRRKFFTAKIDGIRVFQIGTTQYKSKNEGAVQKYVIQKGEAPPEGITGEGEKATKKVEKTSGEGGFSERGEKFIETTITKAKKLATQAAPVVGRLQEVYNILTGVPSAIAIEKRGTFEFYSIRKAHDSKIQKSLANAVCEITDRFLGSRSVVVTDWEFEVGGASGTSLHYKVKYVVLDDIIKSSWLPPALVNAREMLENASEIIADATDKVNEYASLEEIPGVGVIDRALDIVSDTVALAYTSIGKASSIINEIDSRQRRALLIYDSIVNLKNEPKLFEDLVEGLADAYKKYEEGGDRIDLDPVIPKHNNKPIVDDSGEPIITEEEVGNIEWEQIKKEKAVSELVNGVKFNLMLAAFAEGSFISDPEFKKVYNELLVIINHLGLSKDEVTTLREWIKGYYLSKELSSITELDIKKPIYLRQLCVDLYGNTDRYDDLRKLNGFLSNYQITGKVKVFV